jgi:phosphatidylglycerophosphate synthase
VYGEGLLLGMLGRDDDGPVSRHINRRLSRPITRLLMNSKVRPSHITVLSLLISLAAAGLMAGGVAWAFLAGAALYQLGSVLRGVDGELARLRWQFSERGAWLDTVTDDVSNLAFQVGLGYGIAQATGQSGWFILSLATAGAGMLLCGALYRAVSALGLGTYRALDWRFRDPGEAGAFQRFCASFAFLAGRDVYSALALALAAVGVVGLQIASVLAAVIVAMVSVQLVSSRIRSAAAPAASRQVEKPARS